MLADRAQRRRIDVLAEVGLTPFAGRARELCQLGDAFANAAAGEGQVVFVVGDAGIGKSRLLLEFRRSLAGTPHLWFEDRDDDAAALAKVDAGVAALGGELAWTLPFVRQLLSLPAGDAAIAELDAGTRRAQTFAALRALVVQATLERPLVFLIEDLHWIDAASEEYLAFLSDTVPATPGAARMLASPWLPPSLRGPELPRAHHPAAACDRRHGGDHARAARRERAPRRDSRADRAQCRGQPLLHRGAAKSLLEQGAASGREVDALSVPDTIQDVLLVGDLIAREKFH